jgi:hypothetical protein
MPTPPKPIPLVGVWPWIIPQKVDPTHIVVAINESLAFAAWHFVTMPGPRYAIISPIYMRDEIGKMLAVPSNKDLTPANIFCYRIESGAGTGHQWRGRGPGSGAAVSRTTSGDSASPRSAVDRPGTRSFDQEFGPYP